MKKRIFAALMALTMVLAMTACGAGGSAGGSSASADADFPTKDINGIVQWGEGGGTDNLVRPLCTVADKLMDVNIVVSNVTGAVGSIATTQVYNAPADGYNLLLGAENPALYQIMDIIDLTYDNFETVLLIGSEDVSIVVPNDSPYNTVTELIDAAKEANGSMVFAATGEGGSQWQAAGLIGAVTGAEFTQVPLDSDADCLTAVMGGQADATTIKSSQVMEAYEAGTVKILATLTAEPVEVLPGTTPIVDEIPEFAEYLPFGPFYGVFVKEGTPEDVVATLSDYFQEAFASDEYQQVLTNLNIQPLGLVGDEANDYIENWTKSTAKALYNAKLIEKSPAELGLE